MKRFFVGIALLSFLSLPGIYGQNSNPNSVEQQLQRIHQQQEEQQREIRRQQEQQREQQKEQQFRQCEQDAQQAYNDCQRNNPNGYCVLATCQ